MTIAELHANEKLRPAIFGWHNVRCPDFVAQETLVIRPDARRQDRQGREYLRISPHFYNTDAELHRLLELL